MRPKKILNYHSSRGLTLAELMVAAMILLPLLTVVMQNFITCMEMNVLAQQTSQAMWAERTRMAAIEKTPFDQIYATFDRQTFSVSGLNGIGVSYVDNTVPDLLTIYISFSWKDRNGTIHGEDTNLNGQINGTEDKNNNGRLDSPVGFATVIYNKS
ncbi:MAG: hypothetical protein HQL17_05640 [Candidatus Omnitrophica bacterium]|nr:hypothetical protein [Candidatus Omnitrophota bacterium]